MKKLIIYISLVLSALSSCVNSTRDFSNYGQSVEMRHAEFLTMTEGEGYILAQISNPWDSAKVLHSYVLVPKDKELPHDLPQGDVVRTPLSKSAVYTSVHCSLIDQLGAYNSIAGICDAEYIYLDKIQADVKSGKIKDFGNSMSPNIEKIIEASPDAILLSPFENSGSYGKLGKLGIPIIECADYMETSALGRAEWMRFFGILFGRGAEADSLFTDIEQSYNSLKDMVAKHYDGKENRRPTVVTDAKFGSTWYVAGANSTMGRLLSDAGADYIFSDVPSNGSVPYSPEVVFDRGQSADVWLIKYNQATDKTLTELANDWSNNSKMSAFRNHRVYGCNLSKVPFYEETPFHPDLLLKEYIRIFTPELLPEYTLKYYKLLQD